MITNTFGGNRYNNLSKNIEKGKIPKMNTSSTKI